MIKAPGGHLLRRDPLGIDAHLFSARLESASKARTAGDLSDALRALDEALGRPEDALAPPREPARRHPLCERPRELLMLALHACGRQAEALRVFEEARRVPTAYAGAERVAADLARTGRPVRLCDGFPLALRIAGARPAAAFQAMEHDDGVARAGAAIGPAAGCVTAAGRCPAGRGRSPRGRPSWTGRGRSAPRSAARGSARC
ncbi:BTAD domain-containing putative transcriptional regulator [Nonomuraea sp. NPDC049309]|uniref:BTAD domain-containing putative transcriptional regulator n=1 Tax=Nonomuraea sp. NPDC049309 TaxID=3364350 RepID=UPI003715CAEE